MYLAPCRRYSDSQSIFLETSLISYIRKWSLNQLSIQYDYCCKKNKITTSVYYFKKRNVHAKWSGVYSVTGGRATIQTITESPNISLKSERGGRNIALTTGSAPSGTAHPTPPARSNTGRIWCLHCTESPESPIPPHLVRNPSSGEVRWSRSKGQWLGKTGGTVCSTVAGQSPGEAPGAENRVGEKVSDPNSPWVSQASVFPTHKSPWTGAHTQPDHSCRD